MDPKPTGKNTVQSGTLWMDEREDTVSQAEDQTEFSLTLAPSHLVFNF